MDNLSNPFRKESASQSKIRKWHYCNMKYYTKNILSYETFCIINEYNILG